MFENSKQFLVVLGLFFSIFFSSCGTLWAADYRLVTGDLYPPYADQKYPEGGLAVQIVKRAFAAIGKSVSVEVLPWARGYALTAKHAYDGTFPYIPTAQRLETMQASESFATITARLWSRAGSAPMHFTTAALAGKSFCLPLGYGPPASMQGLIDRNQLTLYRPFSTEDCLKMVDARHADFLAADVLLVRAVSREIGVTVVQGDIVHVTSLTLLGSKDAPKTTAMLRDFAAGLARIKADGTYSHIMTQAQPL
jgi:polar amino acid transport system substrate-binding protein